MPVQAAPLCLSCVCSRMHYEVARAEVTWRNPQNGEPQQLSQTSNVDQFVPHLHRRPATEGSALVAEGLEQLRGSLPLFNPAWPNPGSLEPVVQLSHQVDSRLLARPSYSAYLGLLEKAAAARPYRSGGEMKPRSGRLNGK